MTRGDSRARFTIKPKAPYDFDLSCQIFSEGDPQIRAYDGDSFHQVLSAGEERFLARIASEGDVDAPVLNVELVSPDPLSRTATRTAETIIHRIFQLDLALGPFYLAMRDDPVLSPIIRDLRGLKSPRTPQVFEALVDSILEQQISLQVARTLESRLTKAWGRRLVLEEGTFYEYPRPQDLAPLTPEDLRGKGASLRKAEYILGVSKAASEGSLDLESMEREMDDSKNIEMLTSIRGIGRWTAELTLLRGLGRVAIVPADDLGLRRIIAFYHSKGKDITGDEARRIAQRWGEWKGLAAYYLMIARRLGIGNSPSLSANNQD